jgi:hypothetical protein
MLTTTRPVLTFYGRTHCEPCSEARSTLQWVLEERASLGQVVPRVVDIDVSSDADLEARYGGLVPVVAVADSELPLVMSARQLRTFLDATLPRLA